MTVTVENALSCEQEWEQFVADHPDSTFFHRFAWSRVLRRAFGHKPHFLLARRKNALVGVLPLAEVRSYLFGSRLVSLPFCVYGGALALDADAAKALRSAACDLAERLGVGNLELRNVVKEDTEWLQSDLYVTFRKTLSSDHAENLKAIPNRQRAMLRKALKEGLFSEECDDPARVYRIYSESVRNLGTPVFSVRYFRILREEFGADCRLLVIRQTPDRQLKTTADDGGLCDGASPASAKGAEDVAGVLSFYHKGEVLPYYGGGISRARHIKGCNHFLYWELMRRSVDEGVLGFDFGRSKRETGPYQFKKNLGFDSTDLHYQYHLVRDSALPEINPTNPRYQRKIELWKKLPLPVANTVGPYLARSLG